MEVVITRLRDKVAVVTGAASGIGRAIARRFAMEGARLMLADIDAGGIESAAAELRAAAGEVSFCPVDVSDASQVDALMAATLGRYERVDVLSHNAGVDHPVQSSVEIPPALWERVMAVNARGTFLCNVAAIKAMLAGSGGSIINTVSDLGFVVVPGLAAYCASKGAALQVTRALAAEYAPRVRVNALCPTMVDTPMGRRSVASRPDPEGYLRSIASEIPMRRIAQVSDLVGAAVFLASDESEFITGVVLPIDGGRTVL